MLAPFSSTYFTVIVYCCFFGSSFFLYLKVTLVSSETFISVLELVAVYPEIDGALIVFVPSSTSTELSPIDAPSSSSHLIDTVYFFFSTTVSCSSDGVSTFVASFITLFLAIFAPKVFVATATEPLPLIIFFAADERV